MKPQRSLLQLQTEEGLVCLDGIASFFPKTLVGLTEDSAFSYVPLPTSTEKPQQHLKQGSDCPSPGTSFSIGDSVRLPLA